MLDGQMGSEGDHALVRQGERALQEAERIEQRTRALAETLEHRVLHDLCGTLAIGVPAHAVAGTDQRSFLIDGAAHPVLIGIAAALMAELRMFDAQAGTLALG
jgi:hypothetical protein